MSIKIEIGDPLASILKSRADSRHLSPDELVTELLGDCLIDASFETQNQRRIELIKKSHRGNLDESEKTELQALQEEVDQGLEKSDRQLLDYLKTLKEEVVVS